MKKAYILGHPLGHSLSPIMHNAAFKHLGIDAEYRKKDILPKDLAKTIELLRQSDIFGANVTIPYKLDVMPFMDTLSDAVKAIGAVNTIVNNNGKLLGHNTDASGYIRALQEEAGFEPKSKVAVMLGAGGAARAVAYALLSEGVSKLYIYNRTFEKANSLAKEFSVFGNIQATTKEDFNLKIKSCDLLVNTTSVGMESNGKDPNISPVTVLPSFGFVSDIVYRPAKTQLLCDAEEAGLSGQNGLAMLVYQGAAAFDMWTRENAPVEIMFKSLLIALEE